jgi:hypothetical protein
MKRKAIKTYFYLTAGMVLLILISFHYLTNFSTYWQQSALKKHTVINQVAFELLDYQQCPHRCHDALFCDNFYLLSVNSTDEKALFQLMKDFKPFNHCQTLILIQQGKIIDKKWKELISSPIGKASFPVQCKALCYWETGTFSITNLANGKANGKFKVYKSDGHLYIEQEIAHNKQDGKRTLYEATYRIEQVYRNDSLVSEETIKK